MNPNSLVTFAISIHAPTRGATKSLRKGGGGQFISIHAPTRGATFPFSARSFNLVDFNPRSYERSDGKAFTTLDDRLISIHAPTRGATLTAFFMEENNMISIHAPTRGATRLWQRQSRC